MKAMGAGMTKSDLQLHSDGTVVNRASPDRRGGGGGGGDALPPPPPAAAPPPRREPTPLTATESRPPQRRQSYDEAGGGGGDRMLPSVPPSRLQSPDTNTNTSTNESESAAGGEASRNGSHTTSPGAMPPGPPATPPLPSAAANPRQRFQEEGDKKSKMSPTAAAAVVVVKSPVMSPVTASHDEPEPEPQDGGPGTPSTPASPGATRGRVALPPIPLVSRKGEKSGTGSGALSPTAATTTTITAPSSPTANSKEPSPIPAEPEARADHGHHHSNNDGGERIIKSIENITNTNSVRHNSVESSLPYRSNARSVSPAPTVARDYGALPLSVLQSELRHNHRVLRVCLTGGPCAGKSTMMAEIQANIPQRTGFQVYCVPEAATMLVTGGMKWDGSIALDQQLCLLRTQLALEDQFYALAVASGLPTIVMSDRGTMDGRAFCSKDDFDAILSRLGSTLDVLRDRYDAVVHMVTAACGAEAYYNMDNPARFEDLDGARESDLKLRQMYVGHPYFRLLDNSSTFDAKVERGLQVIANLAGKDGADNNGGGGGDDGVDGKTPSSPAAIKRRTSYFLLRSNSGNNNGGGEEEELPVLSARYRVFTTVLGNSQMDEMRLLQLRVMADGSRMHFFKSVRKPTAAAAASGGGGIGSSRLRAPPPMPSGNGAGAFRRSASDSTHASTARAGSGSDDDNTAVPANPSRRGSTAGSGSASARGTSSVSTGHILGPNVSNHSSGGNTNSQQQQQRGPVFSALRISSKEYACLVNNRDRQREVVEAEAIHFIHDGANFELVTILSPAWAAGKQTLTVEYDELHNGSGDSLPEFPDFLCIDREVPLDSTTTAFLISHKETGPLYTSLAFAPVFLSHYGDSAGGASGNYRRQQQKVLNSARRNDNNCSSASDSNRQDMSVTANSSVNSSTLVALGPHADALNIAGSTTMVSTTPNRGGGSGQQQQQQRIKKKRKQSGATPSAPSTPAKVAKDGPPTPGGGGATTTSAGDMLAERSLNAGQRERQSPKPKSAAHKLNSKTRSQKA